MISRHSHMTRQPERRFEKTKCWAVPTHVGAQTQAIRGIEPTTPHELGHLTWSNGQKAIATHSCVSVKLSHLQKGFCVFDMGQRSGLYRPNSFCAPPKPNECFHIRPTIILIWCRLIPSLCLSQFICWDGMRLISWDEAPHTWLLVWVQPFLART